MNKSELVTQVTKNTERTQAEAIGAVDTTLGAIQNTRMNHREIYHKIVSKDNQGKIRTLLEGEISSIGYGLLDLQILDDDGFPYIYCAIETDEIFAAQMIGFIVKISHLFPDCHEGIYYLPAVAYCDTYPDDIRRYMNKKISINHEIIHIKDILTLIESDPQFPEKIRKYGKYGPVKTEDLPKSIDLEIFKVFYTEPKAMKFDYESGEKHILFRLSSGEVFRFPCKNIDEYIMLNMESEILRIRDVYFGRFQEKEIIVQEIKKAVTKYGKSIFGANLEKALSGI